MKKLITLLLVLTGIVSTAMADDYVKGSWDGWANTTKFDYSNGTGKLTLSLAASTDYKFKFINSSTYMGNNGTMTSSNCIKWGFGTEGGDCTLTTTIAGNYEFIVTWENAVPYISVIYPVSNQYTVHFKKGDGWPTVYAHRYVYLSGNTLDLTAWPGNQLSENTNNSGYYDVTFSDSYNYIVFNDNGSDTNKSGNVAINFSYPETWVTDNATIQTTAPDNWVGYTRNVTSGKFGTICLPFAATVTGAKVFKITGKVMSGETLTALNLESVDALEAGKAYIFKATDETLTATYSGSYTEASAGYGMMGNISSTPVTLDGSKEYYVVSENKVKKVVTGGSGVTVGQYRGYITLAEIGEVTSRGADFIAFDNESTGIEAVKQEVKANGEYYNLAGQRVAQPTKGLYIVNGKKVIMK